MAKAWDTAVINVDSNHAEKGRAGVIQAVQRDADGKDVKLTIRLDETPDGKEAKVVEAAAADVTVHHVF